MITDDDVPLCDLVTITVATHLMFKYKSVCSLSDRRRKDTYQ
jgi:hypothetical protein